MIEARGLGRKFGDQVAVEDLNLRIEAGEVFGLLGPNGAGKSTSVRLLCGLIAPTSGTAELAGVDVVRAPEQVRSKIGILTETPGLYEKLNAVENLRFFAELYEIPSASIQARVQQVLELVQLWERRAEPVGGFSKGMRQRVAIARALLPSPPVLFLDEPTSGLDPVTARLVRALIADLKSEGRTIVLCTHNLDEAERLCDRVGVLNRRLLRVDTPERLRRELYAHVTRVELAELTPQLLERVRGLPFVDSARAEGNQLFAMIADYELHNPDLVQELVQAGASILSIEREPQSLEQVYFDLLAKDQAAPVGGDS
ncbi:MAG: ABC transporter ATP-binding protein [Myxococcales bacterium]|nr:ABC transporter ATP-binding protein [Myxococcales bacterium]